jgi:hypothetical protein
MPWWLAHPVSSYTIVTTWEYQGYLRELRMVRFIVGRRELDLTKEDVIRGMRGVQPEPIREHLVDIDGTAFPPKQVFEHVTGFGRRTYTTMEANRVLSRLGFPHRRVGATPGWAQEATDQWKPTSVDRRLSAIEATLAVAQEAIAGLRSRVDKLEGRR